MSEPRRESRTAEGGPDPAFLDDVVSGLSARQKTLPAKYFYDEEGLRLFKEICATEEYYLTRSELAIMRRYAREMASAIGPGALLIEYGSGAADKARALLDLLEEPTGYVSIDISPEHLEETVREVAGQHPGLTVEGVVADFTADFGLPDLETHAERRVVYFAGSTIGNFDPDEATELLRGMSTHLGPGDGLLIGIDLVKDENVLHRAYNDRDGRTEAFNRNVLVHINRVLGANFRPERFAHKAYWRADRSRIEMHLESLESQDVRVAGHVFHFEEGETIHTESSHKYDAPRFSAWAQGLGFESEKLWTDEDGYFGVMLLRRT